MVEHSAFFFELIENPDQCGTEHIKILSKVIDRYPYFQMAWSLLYKKITEKNHNYPPRNLSFDLVIRTLNQPDLKAEALTDESKIILKQLVSDTPKTQSISKQSNTEFNSKSKSSQNDLINQFLKSPNKKNQPKKDISTSKQDNLAKQNSFVQSEIATETLANMYVEQGQYNEAIQIYKILQLKFPKKSHTFANRILEIKRHLDHLK